MKRRGYLMVEMVVYVALLAMFTLIASKLFITCMRLAQDSRKSQDAIWRFDGTVRQLRQDVWSSGNIKLQNQESVLLEQPNATTIHWYVDAGNVLVRQIEKDTPSPPQHWPDNSQAVTFDAQPGILLLMLRDANGHETSQIPLICPLQTVGSKP